MFSKQISEGTISNYLFNQLERRPHIQSREQTQVTSTVLKPKHFAF